MRILLPVVLFLAAWGAMSAASARPCTEEDLEVIDVILAEVAGGDAAGADGPDLEALAAAAAEAGCEWSGDPGGADVVLEELRWRDEWGAAAEDDALPWWRVFLPRIELRWMDSVGRWGRDEGRRGDRRGRFELWLLWTPVPSW